MINDLNIFQGRESMFLDEAAYNFEKLLCVVFIKGKESFLDARRPGIAFMC